MRTFLIAGNWKMNCGPSRASSLCREIREAYPEIPASVEVLVCPPFVSLARASKLIGNYDRCYLGAQNVHFEDDGAYTGEISTSMLKEVSCSYVIVGHSERRAYFGETDVTVNSKVKKILGDELTPIVCVGESLDQRKKNSHMQIVRKQVVSALTGVDNIKEVVIAYEPVWAIGTGETATPDQAQEMHEMIRQTLRELADNETAKQMRLLYGGSMKPHNAEDLLSQPDVDGGLIGGASLKADSFTEIIDFAEKLS